MSDATTTKSRTAAPRTGAAAKTELRAQLRASRASIPEDVRSSIDAAICERLLQTAAYENCSLVLTYLSTEHEVDTRRLVERAITDGKSVALPRCVPKTREMNWHLVKNLDGLVVSSFGIEEPADDDVTLVEAASMEQGRTLAVVPALAFDEEGFRIGYGGGFYDTFLARFAGKTAGICRESHLVESLSAKGAVEKHDRAVDFVVTEKRALFPRAPRGV